MSGEYRDELAAAHSRIAELEEKLQIATEKPAPVHDGRFPELEARIALLRKATDEVAFNRRRTAVSAVTLLFPLASAFFSYARQPIAATVASVLFMGAMIYTQLLARWLERDKKLLAEAEAKHGDALRIADLEAQLAAKKNVRVVSEPEPLEDEEEEAEQRRMAR